MAVRNLSGGFFRQAVVTVKKAIPGLDGRFFEDPSAEIIFRQPYSSIGLAMAIKAEQSYFTPNTICNLQIWNPSDEMVDAFAFNTLTYLERPLVEIRAGQSDVLVQRSRNINQVTRSLPVLFTGYPTWWSDESIPRAGGRLLTVRLSDMVASSRTARVGKQYRKGTLIITMLRDLMKIAQQKADFVDMDASVSFSALKLKNSLMFNNRQIFTQVLPMLARRFVFSWRVIGTSYSFTPLDSKGTSGALETISNQNGMIEFPTTINFVHWNIKTLFGFPQLFVPGQSVRVISKQFTRTTSIRRRIGIANVNTGDNSITGLIVEGAYNFNDVNGDCRYKVSPDGQPINGNPILTL